MDFETAQELWNDEKLIEIPAKTEDEEKFIIIAMLNNKHWTAVITYRNESI